MWLEFEIGIATACLFSIAINLTCIARELRKSNKKRGTDGN